MNPYKITLMLSAALLASCATGPLAGVRKEQAATNGSDNLKVTRTLSGKIEGITFFNSSFVLSWEFEPNDGRVVESWLGGDGGQPTYVVRSVSLRYQGKEIPIPRSAYYDFNDPPICGGPYVMASEDEISVFFNLSDGAGSRNVSLDFKDGKYAGRTIHR